MFHNKVSHKRLQISLREKTNSFCRFSEDANLICLVILELPEYSELCWRSYVEKLWLARLELQRQTRAKERDTWLLAQSVGLPLFIEF